MENNQQQKQITSSTSIELINNNKKNKKKNDRKISSAISNSLTRKQRQMYKSMKTAKGGMVKTIKTAKGEMVKTMETAKGEMANTLDTAKGGIMNTIESAKRALSKNQTVDHMLLLKPLTTMKYRKFFCCGKCPISEKIELEGKIKRMIREAETTADAAALLAPVVDKENKERMVKRNWCQCCGCCPGTTANPGYDFLFNRQRFRIVLLMAYTIIFMSLVMLNYPAYNFPPPTCNSLYVDYFHEQSLSAVGKVKHDLWYRPENVTSNKNYFSITIAIKDTNACPPWVKGMDAIGICRIASFVPKDAQAINLFADNISGSLYGKFYIFTIYNLKYY